MKRGLALLITAASALVAQAVPAGAREVLFAENGTNISQVAVVDTQTNQVIGSPIPVGKNPHGIAITPDGRRAYVANSEANSVSVIDIPTGQVVGSPIPVGLLPDAIAMAPNGLRAYVANRQTAQNSVSVIDTQTNQTIGTPIPVGDNPDGIAITPDGTRAYVANTGSNTLSVIDLATDQPIGSPITVGMNPIGLAITPDGTRLYVSNAGSNSVLMIDTATNQVVGSPISAGTDPEPIALTPDGSRLLVGDYNPKTLTIVDTATNQPVGSPIPLGISPGWIAITPDGTRAYAANDDGTKTGPVVIDVHTGQASTGAIVLNQFSTRAAIVPDQPPHAAFTQAISGRAVNFSAAGSSDPDGSIARYDWSFGDGSGAPNAGPSPSHAYALGTFQANLTLTDNEGCSTTFVFTGQTASCNGGPIASATATITRSKPSLTRVSQSARKWTEGAGLPRISRRPKLPVGTTFRFTLNEPASVRFAFTQARGGRRVGRKCVPPSKRNRGRRRCKRTATAGVLSFRAHTGANRVRFKGRLSRHQKLKPGRYTLIITARDSTGAKSRARRLSFTIVKR